MVEENAHIPEKKLLADDEK